MLPTVTGEFRAGTDPELRFAPSGTAVCKIRAVASSRKKVNDEWVDDKTTWVTVTGFGSTAENMAESIKKGDLVVVVGKLQVEDWEDDKQQKRTSVSVVVDHIGPGLKYASASVSKAERGSGTKAASSEPNPWDTGAPASPAQQEDPPF